MSKPFAFFSHSFLKKDKKICEWFKDVLSEFFEIISADKPEPNYIIKKVIPKIDESEYFIALLCKRASVFDDNHKKIISYISSPWIYSELGYALSKKDRKILLFAEKGVHDKGMYPADFEIIYFDREDINKDLEDIKNYITQAIEKYNQTKEAKSFVVEKIVKEVTAYKDGHGIIEVVLEGKILNDNFRQHSETGFGFMTHTGEKIFFNKLSKPENCKERYSKNMVHFHPISENLKPCDVFLKKGEEDRTYFLIRPRSVLKVGDDFKYGVGASVKDIFNECKNNKCESASHKIKEETKKLILKLNLDIDIELINEPKLVVYDNNGNEMRRFKINPTQNISPYFHTFQWKLNGKQLNIGYIYTLTWKRK